MSSIDFSRSSPSYHFLNEWTASQRNKSNVKTKGHLRPEGGLERLLFAFIPLLKGTRSCVLYACPIIHVWKLRLILAPCPESKGLTGGDIKPRTISDKAHHLWSTLVLLRPEFAQGTGEAPNLKGATSPAQWSATSNCTEFTALRSGSLLPPWFPTLSVSSVDPWSSFSPGHGLSLPTVKVKVLVTQLCPTLSGPMDCSPPGSSVHGILQARILEWIAISFSRGSSWLRDLIHVSCTAGWFFTVWATRAALTHWPSSNACVMKEGGFFIWGLSRESCEGRWKPILGWAIGTASHDFRFITISLLILSS